MPKPTAQRLLDHYTDVNGKKLGEDELFDACWSRYLEPKKPLGFGLDEIRAVNAKTLTGK